MEIIRVYFELLGLLPMPFEVAAFIFVTSLLVFWLLRIVGPLLKWIGRAGMFLSELLTRLFLLPEYMLASVLRWFKITYVPGSGIYDDIVKAIFGFIYKAFEKLQFISWRNFSYPKKWVFLTMLLVVVAWYAASGSILRGSLTSTYIEKFFIWYSELRPNELNTIPSLSSSDSPNISQRIATATPSPQNVMATSSNGSTCTIVWVKFTAEELAGKSRSLVWDEIVQGKVQGSDMTSRQFYDQVVEHNPTLAADGYEFKKGKTYYLPECQ